MAGYLSLMLRFISIFPLFVLLSGLVLCRSASADLLSLNLNSSGVLEAAVSDVQAMDTRRFKEGDTLLCIWRLPDIDSIEWPLKARAIVYKRAYRKCWSPGTAMSTYLPEFSGDGSRLVFNTPMQGVWSMNRRGKFDRISGFEVPVDSPDMVVRSLVPTPGVRGFFVLQTYRDASLISVLLDRWRSDIWWIPDLMFFRNSSLIMSRGNSRVEDVVAVTQKEFVLAEALSGIESEDVLGNADSIEALLSGEESPGEEEEAEIDWPWLDLVRLVREKILSFKKESLDETTKLYFLLNRNRFGRLVPGEADMTLYPEFYPNLFQGGSPAAFRLLDEATVIVLGTKGLYRLDLLSGDHALIAELPWQRITHLYGELALSPDHRYAAFRAWTTAQRQEIFLAELATGRITVVVKGEMDLRFIPDRDSEARFNPGVFNFTPDGMALVTLWKVLNGQEMRVYRLLNGDLAPVPPMVEPEEDEESTNVKSIVEAGRGINISIDKKTH